MVKCHKKITEIDVYKSDRQLVGKRAAYRYVIFYKTSHIVIVVQFVNAWQFIIQQTTKATKCAKLLINRAAWFNSIYLNSACGGVSTCRRGNANKEGQGSKE
jgi:hypothetical protein